MNIHAATPISLDNNVNLPEEAKLQQLKDVSQEFEAVMTSTMLKEGLMSAQKLNDEEGADTYQEFAYEQLAYHVGKQGILGISQELSRQLKMLQEGGSHVQ